MTTPLAPIAAAVLIHGPAIVVSAAARAARRLLPRPPAAPLCALALALAPAPAALAQSGEQAEEEEQRPQMGALFYTVEERRILEAIRQGVVEEEELEFTEDIQPIVVIQEVLPEEEKIRERAQPLKLDALIVRRSTGDASVWVTEGGESREFRVNAQTDNRLGGKVLETRAGVVVDKQNISVDGMVGVDEFNNRRFRLQVGQILGTRGELDDSYPIVIRKRSGSGQQ